jgi:hypothetical protein
MKRLPNFSAHAVARFACEHAHLDDEPTSCVTTDLAAPADLRRVTRADLAERVRPLTHGSS